MNWINQIAYHRNIRSEVPNQELAKELAETNNKEGIKEIAGYLKDKNSSIASDCIKVLYEIGYIKPELITEYAAAFLELLSSKQNRMVWGGMIALSTISQVMADAIFKGIDLVLDTIKKGTVITQVSGIRALVGLSLANTQYKNELLPILFDYLEKCRPIDFATRVETIFPVVSNADETETFENIIELKKAELSEAQTKKLQMVLNKYKKLNNAE